MRTLILILTCVVGVAAQDLDDQIQSEYQSLMALLDGGGKQLDEEAGRRLAERFQASLAEFNGRWLPRSDRLGRGRFTLGRALAQQGKLREAIQQFDAFVAAYPRDADLEQAKIAAGTAFLDLGQIAEAERRLNAFLAQHPESEQRGIVLFYLSVVKDRQGAWDEAVKLVRQALAADLGSPLDADARLKEIHYLRAAGDFEQARAALAKLLEENPDAAYLQSLEEQLAWLGKEAPELVKVTAWLNGGPKTLADLRGNVVVLNFFAHFYEACRKELALLGSYSREQQSRSDLQFVALTKFYTPREKVPHERQIDVVRDVVSKAKVEFPVGIADDDFANLKAYGVRGIPWTVVIDRQGNVVHVSFGAAKDAEAVRRELRAAVDRALQAK